MQGASLGGLVFLLPLLAACHRNHAQSALHPASPEAAEIAKLWWVMFGVLSVVFMIVMGLAIWAVFRRKQERPGPPGGGSRFIVISAIVLPAGILLGLLFYSLAVSRFLGSPDHGVVVQVTGFQWWWDVRYPESGIVTANELYIPAGEPVRIELRSADVIHSFWVPNLHGKMDATPGLVSHFWLNADEPGVWQGQCAEFCGRQHALMSLRVVAVSPEEFQQWVEERRREGPSSDGRQDRGPASPPEEPSLARGQEVFFRASCHECHTIRGTGATGMVGPDLTHVGSRLTLGAGAIPNTTGNLMGWIANPQEIKPGNLMPRTYVPPEDLRALADYLQSLE